MSAEAQEELFDYFAPEASYDGNLAHQPLREEPSPAKAPAPKKTPQVTKKSLPLWKRATVLVAVLMVAGGLLMIAAGYSQLFTAKQKLAQMQEQLQEQITEYGSAGKRHGRRHDTVRAVRIRDRNVGNAGGNGQ